MSNSLIFARHLGLGPADFALGFPHVAVNDVGKLDVLAPVDAAGFGKFRLSSRQPRFGGLFAVEGLVLSVDDLPLTFEQDLRQIRCRTVFTSPSNYRSHRRSNFRLGGTTFFGRKYDIVVPVRQK